MDDWRIDLRKFAQPTMSVVPIHLQTERVCRAIN
jgi:hypothetical protein